MCSGKPIDSVLLFKLFRTRVGFEEKISQEITAKHQNDFCFKVLGKYDLLQVRKIESIDEITASNRPTEILELMSLPCICFKPYTMHDFLKKQESMPAACFVMLKVNPDILGKLPSGSFVKLVEDFSQKIIEEYKEIQLVPFLGLGYYESILWLPTNNFEEIFNVLEFVRHYENDGEKFSIDTMTYPLVSYKEVIEKKDWMALQGDVRAIVKARCDPPGEDLIPENIKIKFYDSLGEDDIVYFSEEPELLSGFIEKLMLFREEFAARGSVSNTSTQLISVQPIVPTQGGAGAGSQCIKTTELDQIEIACQEIISALGQVSDTDDYVLALLQQFLSFITSNKHNLLAPKDFKNIKGSLSFLKKQMEEYKEAIAEDNAIEKYNVEADLLFFLEALHSVLLQKIPGSELSQAISTPAPVPHSLPVSVILKAISKIPEFLFLQIKSSGYSGTPVPDDARPNISWGGFVYLDIKEGYRLVNQREIISVPHRHVLTPWNWITLSHEVGHAYYTRIDFLTSEKAFLDRLLVGFKGQDKLILQQEIDENVWEVFSHWCDFRHFFNGNIKLYFRSIWRTWLEIPRVYEIKTDYWFRCLMIFMSNNHKDCKKRTDKIYEDFDGENHAVSKGVQGFIGDLLEELEEFILTNVHMSVSQKETITLTKDEKRRVTETALRFFQLVYILEGKYVNTDLLERINRPYDKLDEHVRQLLNREIVTDEIYNPFLLIREILKYDLENNSSSNNIKDPTVVFAIIYSLSGNAINKN